MKKQLSVVSALVAGLVFSIGLGLAGMTDPAKVIGFLDVTGDWNPSLMFVMGGAMGTHALLRWAILRRRERPVLAPAFPKLGQSKVDRRLLGGAALFGAGWGLAGYCPGPALTAIGNGTPTVLLFVAAMMGGMLLFRLVERRTSLPPMPVAAAELTTDR